MVTDNTAYIGTSNWSGDYFTDTAGIGLVITEDTNVSGEEANETIRYQLASVFERDWNSQYTIDIMKGPLNWDEKRVKCDFTSKNFLSNKLYLIFAIVFYC